MFSRALNSTAESTDLEGIGGAAVFFQENETSMKNFPRLPPEIPTTL
jgi:hypothetical protein